MQSSAEESENYASDSMDMDPAAGSTGQYGYPQHRVHEHLPYQVDMPPDREDEPVSRPSSAMSGGSSFTNSSDDSYSSIPRREVVAIHKRDGWKCVLCGARATPLEELRITRLMWREERFDPSVCHFRCVSLVSTNHRPSFLGAQIIWLKSLRLLDPNLERNHPKNMITCASTISVPVLTSSHHHVAVA